MTKAKIGVIGAGWWATEFHIPHLKERDDVELISVCKLEQDELNFVKEKYKPFLLAPLIVQCSIHNNTNGQFSAFYKDENGIVEAIAIDKT